jgi:plasmid stabilization system protein ParE
MVRHQVIWSRKANNKLFEILEFYAQRNKSKTYSIKLYQRFKKELSILKKQPEIGIKTEIESVRGLIIENFILFYEFKNETIIVYTLWDCRQNPNDLKIDI